MFRQKGYASQGLTLSLSVMLVMAVAFGALLIPNARDVLDAIQLKRRVETLFEQSLDRYSLHVLRRHCVAHSSLSTADLPPLPADGIATYQVRYRQSTVRRSAPLGVEVEVTIREADSLNTIGAYSQPDRFMPPNHLIFFKPLTVGIKEWSAWKGNTGCFQ